MNIYVIYWKSIELYVLGIMKIPKLMPKLQLRIVKGKLEL